VLHVTGLAGVPPLVMAALAFGMLHALLPGHGKSVLASYYAGDGRMAGAIRSSCLLILVHVGSAVVPVLTGYALLQQRLAVRTRAGSRTCTPDSHRLVGLWLLWRAVRPQAIIMGIMGRAPRPR
jgi:nickel/cobalt transporter (NicO) family protein